MSYCMMLMHIFVYMHVIENVHLAGSPTVALKNCGAKKNSGNQLTPFRRHYCRKPTTKLRYSAPAWSDEVDTEAYTSTAVAFSF